MRLAERLGGMTVEELAERMSADELQLWQAEDYLRSEEQRDQELEMKTRMMASKRGR